jgi:hypothetical protein
MSKERAELRRIDPRCSLPASSISCNLIEIKILPDSYDEADANDKTLLSRALANETLNLATPHVYGFV